MVEFNQGESATRVNTCPFAPSKAWTLNQENNCMESVYKGLSHWIPQHINGIWRSQILYRATHETYPEKFREGETRGMASFSRFYVSVFFTAKETRRIRPH